MALGTPMDIGSLFKVDWLAIFRAHDWTTPLSVRVSETVDFLVKLVNRCCSSVKKNETPLDEWRAEVCELLARCTVGEERYTSRDLPAYFHFRFNDPISVPTDGEFHLFDGDGEPILRVYRGRYPEELHDHMNTVATDIYRDRLRKHVTELKDNRKAGFECPPQYYSVHLYERDPRDGVLKQNFRYVINAIGLCLPIPVLV
jgi:hypothetical protein